jgi:hypothetical protein
MPLRFNFRFDTSADNPHPRIIAQCRPEFFLEPDTPRKPQPPRARPVLSALLGILIVGAIFWLSAKVFLTIYWSARLDFLVTRIGP